MHRSLSKVFVLATLLLISGCGGGGSNFEDPRSSEGLQISEAKANISSQLNSIKEMLNSGSVDDAKAYAVEQFETVQGYAADPNDPNSAKFSGVIEAWKKLTEAADKAAMQEQIKAVEAALAELSE